MGDSPDIRKYYSELIQQTNNMNFKYISYQFLIYWCASCLITVYLLENILSFVKKKRGTKCKVWQYSVWSGILMTGSFIFCALFLINLNQPFKSIDLIYGPIMGLIYVVLKQNEDYEDVVINNLQNDTECIGAYWAHQAFDAYYTLVLKTIKNRMEIYEEKNNIQFLVKKLILFIPLSCNTSKLLSEKNDENIKYIQDLPLLECDQGANINRTYKNPVYKIISGQDLYIVAEYPSPLLTLWKIQNSLDKEKFCYHRNCFIKTLKCLLENEPCIIIEYDEDIDYQMSLSNFLLSEIRRKQNDLFKVDVNC